MRHKIRLDEPGRRIIPVIEGSYRIAADGGAFRRFRPPACVLTPRRTRSIMPALIASKPARTSVAS
jgi:hypothetical protein